MDLEEHNFPVWGLLPKKETSVISLLNKYPEYDGRGVIIAIFDSGVDPGAAGLQETSDGKIKVIERFDCSGCGDVAMTTIVKPKEGFITGVSGRKLKIPAAWVNPTQTYRVGIKNAFDLYPERLKERIQEEYKEKRWDNKHKLTIAEAARLVSAFETKLTPGQPLNEEEKYEKENLEAQLEHLNICDKKFVDNGCFYDCVLFHDGSRWLACVDTSEIGDLDACPILGEYGLCHEFGPLSKSDQLNFSMNVHDGGNVLELVGLCSSHGTHVASITSACFPEEPERNGIAPGAQIISMTIGDGRLGSMETGTALVRAMIKVMEMMKNDKRRIDIINMSYGEHAHWSNCGRIGELMNEIVNKYEVIWVASAGNHGPALSTIGSPPDISQETIIGVGAFVSPEMMMAEYSMRQRLPGMPYTWSSRGPTIDGGSGVTVCAPGGAITSVPNFTLRNSQLMNGTSMAAPHVAGATALLVSGMKQKQIRYSPYHVKRALENGATFLPDIEAYAQGSGLLNVERSFELLTTHVDPMERDVRFHLSVSSGVGMPHAKGIYMRNKGAAHDYSIIVEPCFLDNESVNATTKINFNVRLVLVCDATYVQHPKYLDLSNMARVFGVKIDTSTTADLNTLNTTHIYAYDVANVEKGALFKIPITVIIPQDIVAPKYALQCRDVFFKPNTMKRHFMTVPAMATWAVLKMRSNDVGKLGKFVIHCMHLLPKQSCKSAEANKNITVTSSNDTCVAFQVRGGVTLEVVVAKYWANIGDVSVDYTITFHGIKPNHDAITMNASDGIYALELTTLQGEEILPTISLKNSVQILRPAESKIIALTARDVIPPGRQIYELNLTYNFHLNKSCEVSPNCPLLSDILYESEFESQLWMIYDSNKQFFGCGDAYPSKYNIKLEKGDYVIKMHIRHDKKDYLEKLTDVPLLLSQKLNNNIIVDVYSSYQQALINGKKAACGYSLSSHTVPLYIAPIPAEKIGKNNNAAQYLTGTITYAKDDCGKRVDTYNYKYMLCETNSANSGGKKSGVATAANKSAETKTKADECKEAVRDLRIVWLGKLEAGAAADALYKDLLKEFPDFLTIHTAYLQSLDPMDVKQQLPPCDENAAAADAARLKKCDDVIAICDLVLSNINNDALLSYLSIKNDQRPDALQTKTLMDRQKSVLIDCLCRKGISLARLHFANGNQLEQINTIWNKLIQFVDTHEQKVPFAATCFATWHAIVHKHYGRALKLLNKMNDDKPAREIDDKLVEIYELHKWDHLARHTNRQLLAKFPNAYRPF